MNGEELRQALRSEMAATTPPPPMSTAAALGTAKRARLRRRTFWACAGSAVAVLAIAGISAIAGPDPNGFNAAGPKPQTLPQPLSSDTKEPWPTGPDGQPQQDRTARAGPRHEQGLRLLNEIVAVVPAGYTVPENPANLPPDQMPLRNHQAEFEEKVNGVEVWGYMSSAAVAQGDGMGRLLVEVHTPGWPAPDDPCELAQQFWGMQGTCQVMTVGTAQVGVVVQPARDKRFDQWAAYRHPDGVVVFVAQGMAIDGDSRPPLARLPFSVEQLATLAVDERFHLQ